MAITLNARLLPGLALLTNPTRQLVGAGIDKLQSLAVRLGIVSLPADILLNCDDVVLAFLALRA